MTVYIEWQSQHGQWRHHMTMHNERVVQGVKQS